MKLHWHILGAGAIGSLMASHLYRAGAEVTLLVRNRHRARQRQQPLQLHQPDGVVRLEIPCLASSSVSVIPALLVATKAHQSLVALNWVHDRLTADAPVVLLHNGLGVREQIGERYPALQLFSAVTTEAAHFLEANHLVYAGRGATRIGHPGGMAAPAWFEHLAGAMGDTRWEVDIEQSQWRKLVINAAINPLTALYGCSNGEIFSNPRYRSQARALAEELAELSRARGYGEWAGQLWETAVEVMHSSADNRSSMLQDIEAGRPTEIDHISGYLCRFARQQQIACPHNEELWQRIRDLEGRQVSP